MQPGEPMHQHECERDPEIEALQKEVEKLSVYPIVIAKMEANSEHTKTTVDTMCLEMQKLTDVVHQLALSQVTMQSEIAKQSDLREEIRGVFAKLSKAKEETEKELVQCNDTCNQKIALVNSRLGGMETTINGTADKPGIIMRMDRIETALTVIKWLGGLIAVALAGWLVYIVGSLFGHVFPRVVLAILCHITL